MTITKTHTYSDGSQIELGSAPGKGWLSTLQAQAQTATPRKRRGWALVEALKEEEARRESRS